MLLPSPLNFRLATPKHDLRLKLPVKCCVSYLYIQGLPSLNVGILHSCRGPQIKKNSVNFFCKFAIFFAIFWNFFNFNLCLKVHSFSYNNSILHNFFINDPHLKKHNPKVIEKTFDNREDAHILSKCNKEKIIKIHH